MPGEEEILIDQGLTSTIMSILHTKLSSILVSKTFKKYLVLPTTVCELFTETKQHTEAFFDN